EPRRKEVVRDRAATSLRSNSHERQFAAVLNLPSGRVCGRSRCHTRRGVDRLCVASRSHSVAKQAGWEFPDATYLSADVGTYAAVVSGWDSDRFYGVAPREASAGERNQGDPTWAADGNTIVFAGMPWLEYGSTAGPNIHMVDVKTSQVSDIPDSENLFSPRCSQDGRHMAALSADSTKLMLYDVEKKKWSQL